MALAIGRTNGQAMATVALLLSLPCLVGACSSSPREETTGSISRPAQYGSAAPLPPVIQAPATVPVAQPVTYVPVPAYAPRQVAQGSYVSPQNVQACTCAAPRRYEVTASIPRTRPPAPPRQPAQTRFLVHTIGQSETLYSIARMYRTRVADIASVNRMSENARLRSGELLVVPTTVH
ncbi:MAG TPA: LysM domain-containing protein [Pseudolabrys sp.]|nr:LysM domain-containing protein [Pseudolabrys sp.]